jgi:hypothetical protein
MANPNVPRGLVPVRDVASGYVTGGVSSFIHDSGDGTAIYVGAPVKLTGTNYTLYGMSLPGVVLAATTDVIVGVVVGVLPDTATSLPYVAASTSRIVMVDTNPNTLYEIQDANSGTALTDAAVGLNCSFTGSGGNAAYGWSAITLDNTTEATTNTLALKIVGIVNRPDNLSGDTGPAKFLVRINRHQYVDQVAGV